VAPSFAGSSVISYRICARSAAPALAAGGRPLHRRRERSAPEGVDREFQPRTVGMFHVISLLAALAGVALAGTAALMPDTGVDGSPGAYLALLGAVGVALALCLLVFARPSLGFAAVLAWSAGLISFLTALAAWFLMQDALLGAMVVSLVALIVGRVTVERRMVR
jgi:formate/nitrite transporter FocA (FNT family)